MLPSWARTAPARPRWPSISTVCSNRRRGRLLLKGKPTQQYSHLDIARLVGYVFQNPDHQIFSKTVYEEVGFGLRMLGESPKTIQDRVSEVLEVVGLQGYEHKIPFALTKGERQRLAVASVLAVRPQVVVLDEPTTGLDVRQQRDLMEMLKRLNQKGHTVIIITHSMDVAAEYANRVVVLKEGVHSQGWTDPGCFLRRKICSLKRRFVLLRWCSSATGWERER